MTKWIIVLIVDDQGRDDFWDIIHPILAEREMVIYEGRLEEASG